MFKSRILRWVGHMGHMGKKRNPCRILEKKPEGK
jgi:hypothetical protein